MTDAEAKRLAQEKGCKSCLGCFGIGIGVVILVIIVSAFMQPTKQQAHADKVIAKKESAAVGVALGHLNTMLDERFVGSWSARGENLTIRVDTDYLGQGQQDRDLAFRRFANVWAAIVDRYHKHQSATWTITIQNLAGHTIHFDGGST